MTLGEFSSDSGIYTNLFYNCPNLTTIRMTGAPPTMVLFTLGMPFNFNGDQWPTMEEEAAALRLIVPEGYEESYIEDWRTGYEGYPETSSLSGYQSLWNGAAEDLFWDYWRDPTYEETLEEVERRLLEGENHVRALLGMEPVETASHRYSYVVDDDGMITLTGAKGVRYTELNAEVMEMPSGWGLDYIGADAFAESPDLHMVLLPKLLCGISDNAFRGVRFDDPDELPDRLLTLSFYGEEMPALFGYEEGTPFSFGVPDEKVKLEFYSEKAVLRAWTFPMAGYADLFSMQFAIMDELGLDASPEEIHALLVEKLLTAENRLRGMLGMEPAESEEDLVCLTTSDCEDEEESRSAPSAPSAPTEPVGPVEPVDPVEPVEPSDPADPTDPADPEQPSEPAEPGEPTEPTQPDDPKEPSSPALPDADVPKPDEEAPDADDEDEEQQPDDPEAAPADREENTSDDY